MSIKRKNLCRSSGQVSRTFMSPQTTFQELPFWFKSIGFRANNCATGFGATNCAR